MPAENYVQAGEAACWYSWRRPPRRPPWVPKPHPPSSGGELVFVEQTAGAIVSADVQMREFVPLGELKDQLQCRIAVFRV